MGTARCLDSWSPPDSEQTEYTDESVKINGKQNMDGIVKNDKLINNGIMNERKCTNK